MQKFNTDVSVCDGSNQTVVCKQYRPYGAQSTSGTLRVNYDNLQDDMLAYLFFEALTGLWVASVVGEWLGSTFCAQH